MSWWNVIKNQIASAKGKTFQLDFSRPMVEDTNCKDELRELANKMKQISSIDGYEEINKRENDVYGYGQTLRLIDDKSYIVEIRSKDKLNEVPEEVCCTLIDMYKSTANNDYKMSQLIPPSERRHLQGFDLYVEKSRDNLSDGAYISTQLSIYNEDGSKDGDDDYMAYLYLIEITAKTLDWHLNKRPNLNRKICEKLTKEHVKL